MRQIIFGFLIVAMNFSVFPQKSLSLDEAISIALNKNTTLQKNQNNLTTYESGLQAAYGNLLPSVSASGSWRWTRTETGERTFSFGGSVFTIPQSTNESRDYSASIGTDWTLFDGLSNFAGVSQSQTDLESARLTLERLKQDIVFQTISLYYTVINNLQVLKVKEDDVIWNKKNLETIVERNKLGAVTLADVYAQEVRYGNAELELVRAKNDLETSKSNLLYYLGLDVLENYVLTDTTANVSDDQMVSELINNDRDLDELLSNALNNRPDYKSSLLNLESAYDGITIAKSGHFPRLSNSIGYNLGANRLSDLFDNRTFSVGLSLNIPIFSGFSVSNRVQSAEVLAMNREIEISELERQIKKDIQKTFLDLQAASKNLIVGEKNVISARENLKIESEKYNIGSGKLLDVLIANSGYTNALTLLINSKFSYMVLAKQLRYYLGIIEPSSYE
ncbi:MAG: TolC family protein [Ignavibacteriaceae bacterium]|nr:TolC family protein [Ignavibacteriaceae bacterium]